MGPGVVETRAKVMGKETRKVGEPFIFTCFKIC